jgi:uncharacterized surface protein with fasciclin (FAS1) repeats
MKQYLILLFAGMTLYLASCEKKGISGFGHIPYPVPDSSNDLRKVLAGSPYTLFRQAAIRAGLDSLLPTGNYFTILAPVDSAMQSAGLTASVIGSMALDSLQRIVLYHVAQGTFSPASLTAAVSNIQATALLQDISYNNQTANVYIYLQQLFLKITGSLYVNGEQVNNPGDTALTASNGYIYPIRTVLRAPEKSLWGVLEGRPELSMYLAALRIDDSIYYENGLFAGNSPILGDSVLFNTILYSNQYEGVSGISNYNTLTTVFAPTNAAFAAAGFHTPADLLAYAANYSTLGVSYTNGYQVYYLPLDSVLKQHLVGNINYTFTNLNLYNDLLFNPDINNGGFNAFHPGQPGTVYSSAFLLQFFNKNNTANIQWSNSGNTPQALLPADRSRHFMAQNGVVYEIDQLFYPHN